MDVQLRPGRPEDADTCGRICYDAFGAIAAQHRFPSDFPSPQVGIGVVSTMLAHPQMYSVVAEVDGRVVGSNFLDERSAIAGVGPEGSAGADRAEPGLTAFCGRRTTIIALRSR